MKFRRLTLDELQELEQPFIQFLAANTITGPDWAKLKEEDPQKASGLVDIFSDIAFERIVKNIEYLEFHTPTDIKTFHCAADTIVLHGLRINGDAPVDFSSDLTFEAIILQMDAAGAHLQMYSAAKNYHPNREQEVFTMLESGARISRDGALFKAIAEHT